MFYREIEFVFCALCLIQLSLLSVSTNSQTSSTTPPGKYNVTGPKPSGLQQVVDPNGNCSLNTSDYSAVYNERCGSSRPLPPLLQYFCGYIVKILQKVCTDHNPQLKITVPSDEPWPESRCEDLRKLAAEIEQIHPSETNITDSDYRYCQFICAGQDAFCQLFRGSLLLLQHSVTGNGGTSESPGNGGTSESPGNGGTSESPGNPIALCYEIMINWSCCHGCCH
ncbi:uncharacterized protein LOC135481778 [Liolophura sinensis]|uniref:uncharacterized protein LOC135481778 n=1 Tax=Liolophura sinensis TaxID=3198878 RepID=UPI0031597350